MIRFAGKVINNAVAHIMNLDLPKEILKEGVMKKILVLAACMVFLMAGVAQAELITYTGVGPGEAVTINSPLTPYSGGALAGMYNFDIAGPSPYAGSYKGFCVDPMFEVTNFSADIVQITSTSRYAAAAYLMASYYNTTKVDNTKAAQVQLAIWELVFDFGGTYDVTSGNFSSPNYNTEVMLLVNEAVASIGTFDLSNSFLVGAPDTGPPYFGASPQDFMFQTVPEPMTMILFGLGLIGLAGLRRKE
jgi:hypothetical protein